MNPIDAKTFQYDVQSGLSDAQVAEARAKYGSNKLTPPKRDPWWKKFLAGFNDPTIRILLAAAALSLVVTGIERGVLKNEDAAYWDSIGIFLAVALATLVGFFSERKSSKEFEKLNEIKENVGVKVVRNGQTDVVDVYSIVVGDVVRLDAGDKIPADGVVLESLGLRIDRSMLTGESIPFGAKAWAGAASPANPNPTGAAEAPNPIDLEKLASSGNPAAEDFRVARGTTVVDGNGLFLVTAVGDKTEMGKIAEKLAEESTGDAETPLVQKLGRLAKQISAVGAVGAAAIFTAMAAVAAFNSPLTRTLIAEPTALAVALGVAVVLGIVLKRFALKPFFASMEMEIKSRRLAFLAFLPAALAAFVVFLGVWGAVGGDAARTAAGIGLLKETLLAFVVAVTIVVVAVPEGLPMMVTISLALNMRKMVRENCLVRRLVASETIGSATVICTDKTGTLTQNRMTPVFVFADGKPFERDALVEVAQTPAWERLANGIAIDGEANLRFDKNETTGGVEATGIGNPTECALLRFLFERGRDYRKARGAAKIVAILGHNSDRKASLAVVEEPSGLRCYRKGAPERILARCSFVLIDGKPEPIAPFREAIDASLKAATENALRTLAFAETFYPNGSPAPSVDDPEAFADAPEQVFVGFVGLADPLRPEAKEAVERCREAGIQVKMITGDALPTAKAIAKEAGIFTGAADEIALTSEEFAKISDDELPEIAEKIRVLARSTPSDKLRLVKALHRKGEVVATTGDGTNDAPALKGADVGLSMGVAGTEVAKEASDIVLVDDNFKSVVTGVWWGRTLFQNIQRFLQFQLSVNVVALLCALIGPFVGVPLPLTVTQLLWINIIMDTFAAIALSTEPPRARTLREKPSRRDASIVSGAMAFTIATVGLYQTAILFAALFGGWFLDAEHCYRFGVDATDPDYLTHNRMALTIFFTIFVMFQFWHKFNCRALRPGESAFELLTRNKPFIYIVSTITIVQIVMVQIPAVGEFFRTEPLSLTQWLEIVALTATVLPVAWASRKLAAKLGLR